MNLNDDKIKYTAECGQPEAPLSNLNRHWATYYHKQGGFKLAAPSCSGFLAWIDPDRFQNGCSRSGDETLFPISTKYMFQTANNEQNQGHNTKYLSDKNMHDISVFVKHVQWTLLE